MKTSLAACALAIAFTGTASAAALKVERGVNVYRGQAPVELDLAGGEARPRAAATTVVIVKDCRRMRSRVRTQGFYSGHDGYTRRYTQGFYSGPPDFGGRRVVARLNRG
jgi:hypothetical protein